MLIQAAKLSAEQAAKLTTNQLARTLHPIWREFAKHYASLNNGQQAYLKTRPGCHRANAAPCASKLLARPAVKEYVKRLRQRKDETAFLSVEDKREYLREALFANPEQLPPDSPLIQEVRVTTKTTTTGEVEETRVIKVISKTEAIKIDNAIAGHNADQRLNVSLDLSGLAAALGSDDPFLDEPIEAELVTPILAAGNPTPPLEDCRSTAHQATGIADKH